MPAVRSRTPSLVLVGFMGSGKSHVGRLVAHQLTTPFTDTDAVLEERHGAIAEIFARSGEAAFRQLERDVVVAALDEAVTAPGVISLGGGAVLSGDVRDALARVAHVAWLTAPADVLWARVMGGINESRPLAASRDAFGRLLGEREAIYAQVATVRVANDGSRSLDQVVDELAGLVHAAAGEVGA